jgi:hypothetical protein
MLFKVNGNEPAVSIKYGEVFDEVMTVRFSRRARVSYGLAMGEYL